MRGLFDTHAHYMDRRFAQEIPGGADALLEALFAEGTVTRVLNVGTNLETAAQAEAQAARWPEVYAAAGIHPEDAQMLSGTPEEEVARLADWLRQDFRARKIVALGEIGLDYYEGHALPPDPARQQRFFELQLELAEQLDLPVILHDREAHGDLMEILLRHPRVRGVLHSFSGSPEMAQDLVRRGWYVSFSGVLTYRNARKTVETALQVDRSRVLLETDCPYLAPVPYRGRTNHSGRMEATALRLAELWGVDGEEVARVTFRNGCRLFGLPETVRPSD